MKRDVQLIDIGEIVVNPNQPRVQFDEESIIELANSIATNGLIQPVVVRSHNGKYELVAGERRLRATAHLKQKYIEAIVQDYDEHTSAKIAIIENIQRENLTAIEEAIAYEKLVKEHHYTQAELASSLGKSQSTIANKIRLLGLSDKVKNNILDRKITERHGRALLKLPNKKEQEKALNKVIDQKFNVEQTEKYIQSVVKPKIKPMRKKIISKQDYRLEINTIKQALELIEKNGVDVSSDFEENADGVKVQIFLKK